MASNKILFNGRTVPAPEGLTVTNPIDDGEPVFKVRARLAPGKRFFVLHETAGSSAEGCKATLRKKGYGVHFICAPDGSISCHADPAFDVVWHCGRLNHNAIGLEVVNPYTAGAARGVFNRVIPAEWWTWVPRGGTKFYVIPTDEQMKALEVFVPWICNVIGIPYTFPTRDLCAARPRVPGWNDDSKPLDIGSGVIAHRDFAGHSDGRYILEHLERLSNAGAE